MRSQILFFLVVLTITSPCHCLPDSFNRNDGPDGDSGPGPAGRSRQESRPDFSPDFNSDRGPDSGPGPNSRPDSGPGPNSRPSSGPGPNSRPSSGPGPNSRPSSGPGPNSRPGSRSRFQDFVRSNESGDGWNNKKVYGDDDEYDYDYDRSSKYKDDNDGYKKNKYDDDDDDYDRPSKYKDNDYGYNKDKYDDDDDYKYDNDKYNDDDDNDDDYKASEYRSKRRPRQPDDVGNINLYFRHPSNDGKRKKLKRMRFPVHRFKTGHFPRFPPLVSFLPWLPIFSDRLTKQTIIFSPLGGLYIIPPVINFFGQRFSIAQLIASGYCSLVSSGAPPPPAVNVAPLVQPGAVTGPGIPPPDPTTGGFKGGVKTQFRSFSGPRYPKTIEEEGPDGHQRSSSGGYGY